MFLTTDSFRELLYIASGGLFIYGLYGLTGPATAVRGNRIAAVGMAIAVLATCLIKGMDNWVLILVAIIFGTINVVGGFLVTDRMLSMFKRKPEPKQEPAD